jgi:hypothetical protein
MMVTMAIAAVLLGSEREARRWEALRQQAEYHAARLSTLALIREKGAYPYCSIGLKGIPLVYNARTASLHADCVLYHTRMMRKYQLVVRRPWLPVEPDPPEPEP